MSPDDLPAGEMKYSFKVHVQAHGFAGDLIISSTTVNDLVKSIKLLPHAGIEPTTASKCPGSFFCTGKVGKGYCHEKARQ